jgi:hypothetical protein
VGPNCKGPKDQEVIEDNPYYSCYSLSFYDDTFAAMTLGKVGSRRAVDTRRYHTKFYGREKCSIQKSGCPGSFSSQPTRRLGMDNDIDLFIN